MSLRKEYQATLDLLYSQLPMFQRIGAPAFRKDLTNILALCEALGQPQLRYPVIHVAGTNGKGSTCFMLSAVLQATGLKTGLCVSPHYRDFRERARINGHYVPRAFVVDFVRRIQPVMDAIKPSFFEMSTALAFDYFAQEKVDVAVIETGLGGRLDSTNVVQPILAVITNIGFDHTEFLGHTLSLIAGEKAGIIKHQTPVVIGEVLPETEPVFAQRAQDMEAEMYIAERLWQAVPVAASDYYTIFDVFHLGQLCYSQLELNLAGGFQAKNLQTTLAALELLKQHFPVQEAHIRYGLQHLRKLTGFLGRWDVIAQRPTVLCDSAHNPQGMEQAVQELKRMSFRRLHVVLGMVKDKDLSAVLALLPKEAQYYFCKANIPRGLEAGLLQGQAARYGLQGRAYTTVKGALRAARKKASPDDLILVTGSIFVVAEII